MNTTTTTFEVVVHGPVPPGGFTVSGCGGTATFNGAGDPISDPNTILTKGCTFTVNPPAGATVTYTVTVTQTPILFGDIVVGTNTNTDTLTTITFTPQQAPLVTTNPSDQTVTAGQTASFSATASGTPTPSLQWQVSSGGGSFTDLSGATSNPLSFVTTLAQSGNQYRAVFTNTVTTATTTAATLTVNAPPSATMNPSDQTVTAGQTASFNATASGTPTPTLQWQVSTNGGSFSDMSGATSSPLSFASTLAETGNQYRAVFTNTVTTATTTAATLTVNAPPALGPLTISPAQSSPGQQITVTGTDCTKLQFGGNATTGGHVQVTVNFSPPLVLQTTAAGTTGAWSVNFTVPGDTANGSYTIQAVCNDPVPYPMATFTVAATPSVAGLIVSAATAPAAVIAGPRFTG